MEDGKSWPAWGWPGCGNYFNDPFEHISQNISCFSDPDKVARDLTVTTLSKNLLRKYGIPERKTDEGTEQATGQATGSGARQQDIGRKAMTQEKKDKIKTGSMISLGRQGALSKWPGWKRWPICHFVYFVLMFDGGAM